MTWHHGLMNPVVHAARAGWRRGLVELRQTYTNPQDLFSQLFWPVALLVVLFFMRDAEFAGIPLGTLVLPSVLGMAVVLNGVMGMSGLLSIEREDGTLLRAKAIPHGMVGYLVGKVVIVVGWMVSGALILLLPGLLLVDGLEIGTPGAWLTLTWVVLLGTVATLPIGMVVGSLIPNPRSQGLVMLPIAGLIAVSGIFYPITAIPEWLQGVGQVFPVYWLGLGVRSALLPNEAAALELTGSWRHLETVGVLGAWAAIGLLLAPIVLRRMARRESGEAVLARREKALRRIN
jgi:ABC-2 type transport system permease protein